MNIHRSKSEKIFNVFNILFMIVIIVVTIYPLWYILVSSFSRPGAVDMGKVTFFPIGFELGSYKKVFDMKNIWTAYGNTVFYAVVGTFINIVFTALAAYPLSKKRLFGRKAFMLFLMVTMWFNAGMLPTFMNIRNLGLYDTRWAILLFAAVNTFFMILLRTFFENIPISLEESAKIDGANDLTILLKIYLPLSVPALVTLMLYYFVGRWNAFFWSMVLLRDQSKIPLQVLLRRLIVESSYALGEVASDDMKNVTETTIIYSTIVVSVLPMLALYPFIQKYFVKGIMVGAIKG